MFPRRTSLLAAGTLAVVGLAAYLAADIYRSGRVEVLERFSSHQMLIARQAVHEAAGVLREYSEDLHALARLPSVESRETSLIQADCDNFYGRIPRTQPGFIALLDRSGSVVFSSRTNALGLSLAATDFFEALRRRETRVRTFVSAWTRLSAEVGRRLPERTILLATPVYRSEEDAVPPRGTRSWAGVLVLAVDLEQALREHLTQVTTSARQERVWVLDRDGTVLLHSEHPEMARENIHRPRPECAQCHVSFEYAQRMLEGRTGTAEYQLKNQGKKLAAYAPFTFANASWVIVVNTPHDEVAAFLNRGLRRLLLLMGVVGVTLGLGAWTIHRYDMSRARAQAETRGWQDKHRLEEKIRQAEECYRTLFEQSPDGIVMLDPQSLRPLRFNMAAHQRLGYSFEEFERQPLSFHEVPENGTTLGSRLAQVAPGQQAAFETRLRAKNGEIRHFEIIVRCLELPDRRVLHALFHDITERKLARRALEQRTSQLESLHQAGLSIALAIESGGLPEAITRQGLGLFHATVGRLYLAGPHEESLHLAYEIGGSGAGPQVVSKGQGLAGQAWEQGTAVVVEDFETWEGPERERSGGGWRSAIAAPIRWGETFLGVLQFTAGVPGAFAKEEGALLAAFATQAAVAIKNAALLRQVRQEVSLKTTLLHDVNHRVKNHLIRLIEIVRLERESAVLPEPALSATLTDLENRLVGMEAVHSMLSKAQWNPLPLGEIATRILAATLAGSPLRQQIQVTVATPAETMWVLPEQAMALALILNELATNSVKHAFRGRGQGTLNVRLRCEDTPHQRPLVRLEFRDNGPGWPKAVLEGQARHVGLYLVESNVRSPLRGRLNLRNEDGAVAEITFRLALIEPNNGGHNEHEFINQRIGGGR